MRLTAAPMATTIAYARVPRLWPESTIVCVGSGPSLVPEDLDTCHQHPARPRLIVINARRIARAPRRIGCWITVSNPAA